MVRRAGSWAELMCISPLVPGRRSPVLAKSWPSCAASWSSLMLCGSVSGGGRPWSLGGDPGPWDLDWASWSIRAVS